MKMMMSSKGRDAAIKLFGRTIPLPPPGDSAAVLGEELDAEDDKDPSSESKRSDHTDETPSCHDANEEEQEKESKKLATRATTAKKPDKILPCPRCSSLDTKFCYFNNYNANQPRHFCKNCQRYWTAGGTMRNVPVGSGRRKTKKPPPPPSSPTTTTTTVLRFGPGTQITCFNCCPSTTKTPVAFPVTYPAYWGLRWVSPLAPALGKHSRDNGDSSQEYCEQEKRLWTPKTLRIDDAGETAKRSIWASMGIKKKETVFDVLHAEGKSRGVDASSAVLRANPLAFSRALDFHERS